MRMSKSFYEVIHVIFQSSIVEQEILTYIRGKTKSPADSEDKYKWHAENKNVNKWLSVSMSPEIGFLQLPTNYEILSALSNVLNQKVQAYFSCLESKSPRKMENLS